MRPNELVTSAVKADAERTARRPWSVLNSSPIGGALGEMNERFLTYAGGSSPGTTVHSSEYISWGPTVCLGKLESPTRVVTEEPVTQHNFNLHPFFRPSPSRVIQALIKPPNYSRVLKLREECQSPFELSPAPGDCPSKARIASIENLDANALARKILDLAPRRNNETITWTSNNCVKTKERVAA